MSLAPRLDLRQSQTLVMTPQLQQAIRLLALSNLEIEAFIGEELERNPLLEAGGEEGDGAEPAEDAAAHEVPEAAPLDQLVARDGMGDEIPLAIERGDENFSQDSAADSLGLGEQPLSAGSGEVPDLDALASEALSLHEHLIAQAGSALSGQELFVAGQIIAQIDETGYLTAPVPELAQRLGLPLARVEAVLQVVQSFDPAGVGARSLSECLALQAKEADRYDPAMARLIDHLDHLARGNLAALKRICEVDDEDLADMIRELRGYDPKPGCRFGGGAADAVVPDVLVARRGEKWIVELNNATLPRLLVNRRYHAELANGAADRKTQAWLNDCLANANWLIKALDQRARTIVKVASEIVKHQEGFFRHGVAHLRPLTLRAVADAIGMHESTVSRVTSNKYLACERGLFELKYFFTSGVQSAEGGEAVSAEAVKSHIKALIAAEEEILSDDQLVEMLRAKGFDIARRTVAKYREAMGIGSSVQRRRQKAIGSRAA